MNATSQGTDTDITSPFEFFIRRMAQYYKLLIVCVLAFTLVVLVLTHVEKPSYVAVAAIAPQQDTLEQAATQALGLSGLASGLSSVTKRLGLGGGAAGGDEETFDAYSRLLQSYRLAGELAERPDFLALAFPKDWDPQTRSMRPRNPLVAMASDDVKAVLGLPLTRPTVQDEVYRLLDERLSISSPQTNMTNVSEVSFRFEDPIAAAKLLDMILRQADNILRGEKQQDIAARIRYLQEGIKNTTLDDERQSMLTLLTLQQDRMMAIQADHHYASDVIEVPYSPEKPTWPTIGTIIGLIAFLSLLTWCGAIFLLSPQNSLLRRFSRERSILPFRRGRSAVAGLPGVKAAVSRRAGDAGLL